MTDKDQRTRRLQSARKSAPVSAGGVNARRLALHRQVTKEKEAKSVEEEENDAPNMCRNPFCKQQLANRYARFCEEKSMCQRYRALQLQCLANAQAAVGEGDGKPLAAVIKRKASRKEEEEEEVKEETFAIPRKKKKSSDVSSNGLGKRRLNDSSTAVLEANEEETRKDSSSPRPKEKLSKKLKKREKEKKKKEEKTLKKRGTRGQVASETKEVDPPVATAALTHDAGLETEELTNKTLPLLRLSTDTNTDTAATGSKRRRLNRCLSADNVVSRSTSSSPINAVPECAADTNELSVRAKPRTPTQVIRKTMEMDLVPLGVAKQANSTGGGRYVQNGNRSAAQSLRPLDSRPRRPSLTKFPASANSVEAPPPPLPTPAVPAPTVLSHPAPICQPTLPPQTQRPLPPLRPQSSSSLVVPRQTPRVGKPLASPVRILAAGSNPNSLTQGMIGTRRISTSDYLKGRQGNRERLLPRERMDRPLYSSSSLERSNRLSDDRASGVPSGPLYSIGPPRHNNDPLPSYTEPRSTLRDPEVESREQKSWGQHSLYGNEECWTGRSRESWEIPSTFERAPRTFPPHADRYSSRQEGVIEMEERYGGKDYAIDAYFSPPSSPVEQFNERRDMSHESVPSRQNLPPPRRIERQVSKKRERFGHVNLEAPTFSYNEEFVSALLSVFIKQFPHSLEAVLNVTKKPRKMNWYIRYVERIEWLCKDFELKVTFNGPKAVVTVRGREWLVLVGTSTITVYSDVIKSLRAEAITWLRLYEEMEKTVNHYRDMRGRRTDESTTFLRAWNELKRPGNHISLTREANYFYGARLHHWNFVVGKVEIGSGSHEEKREAFRLATISALDFLLSIGRGIRRSTRHEDDVEPSSGGRERNSSRETSVRDQVRANETNNGLSLESQPSGAKHPSSSELSLSAEQSTEHLAPDRSQNSSRASSSVDPEDCFVNASIQEAEFSDQSDEMSISDYSDENALISVNSKQTLTATRANSSLEAQLSTGSAAETRSDANAVMKSVETPPPSSLYGSRSPSALATIANTVPTGSTQKKESISRHRCMMCEMIRMRKPGGARCIRCQNNFSQNNAALGTLLGSLTRAEANQF